MAGWRWVRSLMVIYQQPRAYLLGLEGVALLRAFGGDLIGISWLHGSLRSAGR
jgi:hypothetical protein